MLVVGKCKCGKELTINTDPSVIQIDEDRFKGHIPCHNCGRIYFLSIKNSKVRLGKCIWLERACILRDVYPS